MKLSFVIPAYNEEASIGNCLASIARERRGKSYDIEVVVVNNASNDKTKEVALRYEGVRVVDEPVKGIVHARKAGYNASTGEIVANVDADNVLTRGWIDTVFEEFANDEKLVALSGPLVYNDLPYTIVFFVGLFYYVAYVIYLVNRFVLRIGSMIQGGNFIIRRSALQEIGGFDTSITFYGEDADLARRLHHVGRVKFTFRLPIYGSGRRLAAEGVIVTAFRYAVNYFWITFFKKPFTKKKENDIRTEKGPNQNHLNPPKK